MKSPIKTLCVLALFTCVATQFSNASQYWIGVDSHNNVSTNWSDFNNWCIGGPPLSTGGAVFSNDVSAQVASPFSVVGNGSGGITTFANFNNVVDLNFVTNASFGHGAINSLQYTNVGMFQNTLISSNVTLIVSNGLTIGNTTVDFGGSTVVNATIAGTNGTLSLPNTNETMFVGLGSGTALSHNATLDLSGLGMFNATISHLEVGVGTANNRMDGVLYLALTNTISTSATASGIETGDTTAPPLSTGDSDADSNAGSLTSILYLGQTNAIFTDGIVAGREKSSGSMEFNPNFTANNITPSVYFRGYSANAVAIFSLGDGVANSGTTTITGTADFTTATGGSDGYVNALVDTMYVGRASDNTSGTGISTGILSFNDGIFSVGTLYAGYQTASGSKYGVGTINIGTNATLGAGGSLMVSTNLNLANSTGGANAALTAGTLNINGGLVFANTIAADPNHAGTSTITMTSGILVVTNTMGSLGSPISSLTINSSAVLQLSVTNTATNSEVSTLSSDSSGTINIGSLPTVLSYPTILPVLGYASGGSGVTFSMGTLPGTFKGYISNDNSATIWLVITNGPLPPKLAQWGGGINNKWDTSTFNWTNNDIATNYNEGDLVLFNDSAQTASVNLTALHTPASMTVSNNLLNYTFSGTGGITGAASLVMNGTARLTLTESGGDNFAGGVQVNFGGTVVLDDASSSISGGTVIAPGGTMQIGNNDANGGIPAGSISDNGTLILDQTSPNVISTSISGAGALILNGSGAVTLTVSNTYTGNTTVNAGSLILTNSGSIAGSAQVSISAATLDVSGVAGTTTFNTLSLAGATLDLQVGYIQTNLIVSSLNMSGGTSIINVRSLPPIASFPTTVTLIGSGSISGYNFVLGTLPAGYSGNISQSGNNVVLTVTSGTVGTRPSVVWVGNDIPNLNTNWTDATNWLSPGEPIPTDNVVFNESDAVGPSGLNSIGGGPSQINGPWQNNIVNANFTISTLIYTNIGGNWQNTFIDNGETLTITNSNTNTVLSVGSASADFGSSASEYVTIAGPDGILNVGGTNDSIFIGLVDGNNPGEQVTLDMSGLGTFTTTVNSFAVAAVNSVSLDTGGSVYLAETNIITAVGGTNAESSQTETLSFMVGESGKGGGGEPTLYLGQQNTINANYVGVSLAKQSAQMEFNPTWVNPTATFRGADGVSPVSAWSIGDGLAQSGASTAPVGLIDFTANDGGAAGTVDAKINTMYIGRSPNVSGGHQAEGTLVFGAGTISAGTIYNGYQPFNDSDNGFGTIYVEGPGNFQVGTLNLAFTAGGTGAINTTGTLNIDSGAVLAGTISGDTNATGQSTINLNGGSLIITNTAGTTGRPLTALNISSGTTLGLDVNGFANVTNIVAASISASSPITLTIGSLTGVTTGVLYPLISYGGGDPYSSLNLSLPSGYSGNLIDDTASNLVQLQLTVAPPSTPPRITGISISGGTLTFSATNGQAGGPFTLLETTNLQLPVSQWTPVFTNAFNGSGDINMSTNVVNTHIPDEFYLIEEP
jgi:autotransporter-associated beta strand protein